MQINTNTSYHPGLAPQPDPGENGPTGSAQRGQAGSGTVAATAMPPGGKALRGKLIKAMSSQAPEKRALLPTSDKIARYMCPAGVKETNLRNILPASQFVDVPLKSVPGTVVWVNWDMLEDIDPALKACQRTMSPDFEKQLLTRYCKLKSDEGEASSETGYADRYRSYFGTERGGSGRLCMLDSGESLKGVGVTPLAPQQGMGHSDGCAGIEEAVVEAVGGEARAHLSKDKNKTTRILAIISPQMQWDRPGREAQPMLIVRVGVNARPAHFTEGGGLWPKGADIGKLHLAGEKMFDAGKAGLSEASLLRQHASTAANLSRWRILHGSVNESNLGLEGSSLDFGTFGTQPHTAPLFALPASSIQMAAMIDPHMANTQLFGAEHKMPPAVMAPLLNGSEQWPAMYKRENNIETLSSLGLPTEVVEHLLHHQPQEAASLAKHIRYLGRLFYENHSSDSRADWDEAAGASVADQHGLLPKLPGIFFDLATGQARHGTADDVAAALTILPQSEGASRGSWRGNLALNKYAVEDADEAMFRFRRDLKPIATLYPKLLASAAETGIRSGRWEDMADCLDNICARASRENLPIEALYPPVLRGNVKTAIADYNEARAASMDPATEASDKQALFARVADMIDGAKSSAKRRVDDLLFNSSVEKDARPGVYQLQKQTINGIGYHLEAHASGERYVCLTIPAGRLHSDAARDGNSSVLVKYPVKPYQYTTLDTELTIDGQPLRLQDEAVHYTYAVPNKHELKQILDNNKLA
ncbi:MAG: hypothetical protein V4754_08185 [Pseudomonadota bacterium]